MNSMPACGIESQRSFPQRHPVASYFILTYAISWAGAFLVVAHSLVHGEPLPQMAGLLIFPSMLLGPSVAGILLTRVVDGRSGLRQLFARMRQFRFSARWYAAVLIPPALIIGVLFCLRILASPAFTANLFLIGVIFGLVAGFIEEIGWMGFAFPKMHTGNPLSAAIVLGLLWSLWHVPAINYLGTATPHRAYWFPYFLAFATAMTAMRVLISWLFVSTKSVLLCQLMHASSTGSLVVFSPVGVTSRQEAVWYAIYAVALWIVVAVVRENFGKQLTVAERPLN